MNLWLQIVASNILVASLIGLLAWQVGRSGRRCALAHLLWVVFFVKLVTPPIVMLPVFVPQHWLPETAATYRGSFNFLSSSTPPRSPQIVRVSPAAETAVGEGASSAGATSGLLSSIPLSTWLLLIWLCGFCFVLLKGLVRFYRFHRLVRQAGKQDEEASAVVQKLLHGGSVQSASPLVVRLPIRVSPMLFGFGSRAVIVCPEQLWGALSGEDRRAFLAHETAHYSRRDHWVRWLEWMVTAIYWWFPGVYLARRQLERHEEACCDAWAVQRLDSSPRQYAEALLRVVDFISDQHVGMPRLASGMQPTDSLEERLRLVMRRGPTDESAGVIGWGAGVACLFLWLVHPIPLATSKSLVAEVDVQQTPARQSLQTSPPSDSMTSSSAVELPDLPDGFWNQVPHQQWANFSLALPGAQLVAQASQGISIQTPGREALRFSPDEFSAFVQIPSTQRIVIGDRSGNLRLWDLTAGMPVSLIGRHGGAVTSVAYHAQCGLISADHRGSVMRWDLQSGQVVATWSASEQQSAIVQSVRCSADGATLAILTGGWNRSEAAQRIDFVDSRTLESVPSVTLPSTLLQQSIAVVLPSEQFGWVAVDWSGVITALETSVQIPGIAKHDVSALVLSQNTNQQIGPSNSGS